MPTLVQFGAGNIGRALVGPLFRGGGWSIVYVDADAALVEALRRRGRFAVEVLEPPPPGKTFRLDTGVRAETTVDQVTALPAQDAEAVKTALALADCWGSSVGAGILPRLYPAIADGLRERERTGAGPVNMLLCENWHQASRHVRDGVRALLPAGWPLEQRFGAIETCVGKMVPRPAPEKRAADLLYIGGEAFNRLIADAEGAVGQRPELPGLDWVTHFPAWEERKLYLHNFGHAVLAYHGFAAGFDRLALAMRVKSVRGMVTKAMETAEAAMVARHPQVFTAEAMSEHGADLRRRFANPSLGDTAYRVGRDLPRKLAPGDRLLGAMRMIIGAGGDASPVRDALAAALRYAAKDETGRLDPADQAYIAELKRRGAEAVFANGTVGEIETLVAEAAKA